MSIFKKKRIPTLIGLVLLVSSVVLGVHLINQRQMFRLQAKDETTPKNVRISNITDSSFSISWTTDYETRGFVKWGEKSPNSIATDTIDPNNKTKNHYLTLENLVKNKNYYFNINSEGVDYNSNGLAWQVQTGENLSPPDNSGIIYGTILNPSGQPEKKALVYVSAGGGSSLSTTTGEDGTWAIPLSLTRVKDLSSYISIDVNKTVIEISAQSGNLVTVATIYPIAATPVPPMTLGQTYDFKSLAGENLGNIPKASIEISPEIDTDVTPTPNTQESVSIDNPEEGQIIIPSAFEFSGGGPPGTSITITVESENPMIGSAKTDSNGNWVWSPTDELDPGRHSITVSWRDENGILKNIKRDFTVQAAAAPTTISSLTPTIASTPQVGQAKTTTKTSLNLNFLGLSGLNLIIGTSAIVLVIILLFVFIIRRKKSSDSINPQEIVKGVVNIEPSKNKIVGSGAKIFLIMGAFVLVVAGAFSLYQLYKSKQTGVTEEEQIAQITPVYPSPTTIPSPTPFIPTAFIPPTTTPTPTLTLKLEVTPTAMVLPTAIPTSSPSQKPTEVVTTPTPTRTLTPTPTTNATPTSSPPAIAQTQLPSAGYSLPTYTIGTIGILLIVISFVLSL